jgi:ribosome-associated translation inhibitor RaiA
MQPLQICFHGIDASPTLEELIRTRAEQLARVDDRISTLRVVIEAPHRHHQKGNHFRVGVELTRPGHDIVVGGNETHVSDEDPHQAVRRAFDSLRRRLLSAQARLRGKDRAHLRRASLR